jgi:hypothetical protein
VQIRAAPKQAPPARPKVTAASITLIVSVVIASGDFLGFACQSHDVESAAYAITAITQSSIVDVRVVAGDIQRRVGDAIDHR